MSNRRRLSLLAALGSLATGAGGAHAADLSLGAFPGAPPATSTTAGLADPLKPLSTADARAYTLAFAAARRGDLKQADTLAATIADRCLFGRLGWLKLNGAGHTPDLAATKAWLLRYPDLPEADQAAALIKGRLKGAPTDAAERLATTLADRKAALKSQGLAAREAFYRGEVAAAETLALASGERWIAGLAAYRQKRYTDAVGRFAALSADPTETDWVRSGAAFWAARASVAAGRPAQSVAFLRLAARTPYTFYGLVAERQLGMEPAVSGHGVSYAAMLGKTAAVIDAAPGRLATDDPRAHRAAAYAQLGLGMQSALELRLAALAAPDGRERWGALAERLGVPIAAPRDFNPGEKFRFDLAGFPTPALAPLGGFTLDKALVYALVRQESRFDPAIVSAAGAHGLMQLTAATAALTAHDPTLAGTPTALHDAGLNLRIGQDYFARLLEITKGDLLRAVASYNIGPGVLLKMNGRMESDADTLLTIESMPGAETREFVQHVLANYWIYRKIFGQETPTLDAVASGARRITIALDR